jgi:hypothetical protein
MKEDLLGEVTYAILEDGRFHNWPSANWRHWDAASEAVSNSKSLGTMVADCLIISTRPKI